MMGKVNLIYSNPLSHTLLGGKHIPIEMEKCGHISPTHLRRCVSHSLRYICLGQNLGSSYHHFEHSLRSLLAYFLEPKGKVVLEVFVKVGDDS